VFLRDMFLNFLLSYFKYDSILQSCSFYSRSDAVSNVCVSLTILCNCIVGFYSFLVISFVLFDCVGIVCLFVRLSVSSAFWRINVFIMSYYRDSCNNIEIQS